VKQKLLIFFRWLLQLSTNLTSTQQVASCFLGVTTLHRQGNCKKTASNKTASNFAITEQRKISESDRLFFCNLYSKKRCCRSSY
jgi:hypothetical protein